jgi:hypothetical protein
VVLLLLLLLVLLLLLLRGAWVDRASFASGTVAFFNQLEW